MNLRIGRPASLVVGLLAVAGMLAPAADAAPKKYYKLNVPAKALPSSLQEFKVGLENRTEGDQYLGSANVKVPFDVVGDTDDVVELRGLNLAPGATHTFTVAATTPALTNCDSKAYAWTAQVKQANDFNGTGNDFALLPGSSSNTTLNCNDGFTNEARATCLPNTECAVTITYFGSPAVELTATALETPASDPAGTLSAKWLPETAVEPDDPGMTCEGQQHASPVLALVDFRIGLLQDPTEGRDKRLTLTRSPEVVGNIGSLSELEICGAVPATSPWTFKSPGTAFVYENQAWISGLLADCSLANGDPFRPGIPCVNERRRDDAGNYVVEFSIPRLPGDPIYR